MSWIDGCSSSLIAAWLVCEVVGQAQMPNRFIEPRARLSDWPVKIPRDWAAHVNKPQTEAEVEALRRCLHRGRPYGDEWWEHETAEDLGLEFTMRPRGRPKKTNK